MSDSPDLETARRRAVEAAISAAPKPRPNAPAQLIAAALNSPSSPAIDRLADRRIAAEVVRLLAGDRHGLVGLLVSGGPERIRALMAANFFGAAPSANNGYRLITVETLRAAGTPAARMALAALGEIKWSDATPSERKVLLLRSVVNALSGRAAS